MSRPAPAAPAAAGGHRAAPAGVPGRAGSLARALRAELFAIRTTRATVGVVAAVLVLDLTFLVLQLRFLDLDDPGSAETMRTTVASSLASLLVPCLAVARAAGEHRHRTVRASVVLEPRRGRLLAARLVAAGLLGVAAHGLSVVLMAAVTVGWSYSTGFGAPAPDRGLLGVLAGSVLATALLCVACSALGTAVRSQAGGISALFAWMLVVEPLLLLLASRIESLDGAGRFLLGQVLASVSRDEAADLLPMWAGVLVLSGYAAVLAGWALVADRRDVT